MLGNDPPDVRPLVSQKSLRIQWRSFEYYTPLKRLFTHVADHPGEALSLAQAAAIASLDYTHFSEYFRKKTGVTFKYWIDFVRVRHAVGVLETTDKSVAAVAQDCGFSDSTTFGRTFRRVMGMTPTQFRCRATLGLVFTGSLVIARTEELPKKTEKSSKETEESPRL